MVPALLAALIAGCVGDDPTATLFDFDAESGSALLEQAVGPIAANANLFRALDAAAVSLSQHTGEAAAAPGARPRLESAAGIGSLGLSTDPARALWRTLVTFPPELLGRTLVYSTEEGRYVVSEDAEGAPETGVRFIYYSMNQLSTPTVPLQERGYIDLTDESSEGVDRIRVLAVNRTDDEESVLADYEVASIATGSPAEGALEFTAVGSITSATTTLDFDLSQAFTWSEADDSQTMALEYALHTAESGPVDFSLGGEAPFGQNFFNPLLILVTVQDGADAVELDIALDGFDVDAEIRVNGGVVVDISGREQNLVFTDARGGTFSVAERAALQQFWDASVGLLNYPEWLFTAIELVYALA